MRIEKQIKNNSNQTKKMKKMITICLLLVDEPDEFTIILLSGKLTLEEIQGMVKS